MRTVKLLFAAPVLLLGLFSTQAFGWWAYTPGDSVDDVGYRPRQPIPFSHQLHAGKRNIPCEYCHSGARRSKSAVVPPTETCMGCHRNFRTDKDPIKYLIAKYKADEPIPWVKVHDLPDFVRFAHAPHYRAGLACQDCHGQVQDMEVVEMVAPLQMGWCIGCHKNPREYLNDLYDDPNAGAKLKITTEMAPLACFTCHY